MKKFLSIVILIFGVAYLSLSANATNTIFTNYVDNNFEIRFNNDSHFSIVEKERIINLLLNSPKNPETETFSNGDTTYSIMCNLFGHKLTTETVTTIEHKLRPVDPRCNLNQYNVSTCSRCDYIEQSLISSGAISCCK